MQTFTPYEYLLADVAANFGLDKKEWDTRIQWTKDNMNQLESLVPQAKEQALYYAGVQALRTVQAGKPSGYPISLDASASGTQLLGLLSGCRNSMLFSNVLDSGTILDSYTELHKLMNIRSVTRNEAKQAIMTSFYNSKAIPKKIFPNRQELAKFYATLKAYTPGAFRLNEMFQRFQDPNATEYNWTLPDGYQAKVVVKCLVEEEFEFFGEWDTAKYKVKAPTDYDNSLSPNAIHSVDAFIVREMVARCSYDPVKIDAIKALLKSNKQPDVFADSKDLDMVVKLWDLYKTTGFLSARILNFLNEETINLIDKTLLKELVDSLPKKSFQMITIHDAFRVLPSYGNDTRFQYNNILGLLHNSNVLAHLLSQLGNKKITIDKLETFPLELFHQANYSLN